MKVIGKVNSSTFLVQASEDDLAKIMGFRHSSYVPAADKPEVGRELQVSELWDVLNITRERHEEIKKMAASLRGEATRLDKVNNTLAKPIIETEA